MGDTWFKIRDMCRQKGVRVYSSNYALYGDMSARVNAVYRDFSPRIEVYSIDESFLDISDVRAADRVTLARDMRETVRAWTGIPTCIGIGATKTLAKLANHVAKKQPRARRGLRPDRPGRLRPLDGPDPAGGHLERRPGERPQARGARLRERRRRARPRHPGGAQGHDGGRRAPLCGSCAARPASTWRRSRRPGRAAPSPGASRTASRIARRWSRRSPPTRPGSGEAPAGGARDRPRHGLLPHLRARPDPAAAVGLDRGDAARGIERHPGTG